MSNQYPESYDCGRVNLWVKDSKKTDDKFLSGIIEFFQPDGTLIKVNIRAFKNNKRSALSADFFGSVSVIVDGPAIMEFSEKVEQPAEVKSNPKKPPVSKQEDLPLF